MLRFSAICDSIVDEPVRTIGLDVLAKQASYSVGFALISIVPVREVQPENVSSISVTPFGIVGAVVREVQRRNVPYISVTLFGILGAVVRERREKNIPLLPDGHNSITKQPER